MYVIISDDIGDAVSAIFLSSRVLDRTTVLYVLSQILLLIARD